MCKETACAGLLLLRFERLCEFYELAAQRVDFLLFRDYWAMARARRDHEHVEAVLDQAPEEVELDLERITTGMSFLRAQSLMQFFFLAEDGSLGLWIGVSMSPRALEKR
jgi:hypothetical protein